MVDRYRRRIAATVIQLAKDDPELVREMIGRLKVLGEIEVDELQYLEQIADKWIEINAKNAKKGRR